MLMICLPRRHFCLLLKKNKLIIQIISLLATTNDHLGKITGHQSHKDFDSELAGDLSAN